MKDEFITCVGVLGQRHYNYLKKHFPTVINVMRMNGTLEQYLKDIDKDAQDMFDKLTKQLADKQHTEFDSRRPLRYKKCDPVHISAAEQAAQDAQIQRIGQQKCDRDVIH